jgi:hypothetical protein
MREVQLTQVLRMTITAPVAVGSWTGTTRPSLLTWTLCTAAPLSSRTMRKTGVSKNDRCSCPSLNHGVCRDQTNSLGDRRLEWCHPAPGTAMPRHGQRQERTQVSSWSANARRRSAPTATQASLDLFLGHAWGTPSHIVARSPRPNRVFRRTVCRWPQLQSLGRDPGRRLVGQRRIAATGTSSP